MAEAAAAAPPQRRRRHILLLLYTTSEEVGHGDSARSPEQAAHSSGTQAAVTCAPLQQVPGRLRRLAAILPLQRARCAVEAAAAVVAERDQAS